MSLKQLHRERYYDRLWRLTPNEESLSSYYGGRSVSGDMSARVMATPSVENIVSGSVQSEKTSLISVDGGESATEEADYGVSPFHTSINIVKCAVGAGSFGVPQAFMQEGLWGGLVGTFLLGAMAAYTITLLCHAEKYLVFKSPSKKHRYTYPEIARALFPRMVIGNVNCLEVLVYFSMCLSSIGVCGIYGIFILQTFPEVYSCNQFYIIIFLAITMLLLALLRSFKYIAFTSIMGDVAVTMGILAAIVDGFLNNTATFDLPAFKIRGVPQASSTLAFLFLVHAIVLPMAQSMKGDLANPKKFEQVAWLSLSFVTTLNALFGMLCYMLFQDGVESPVTGNLQKSWMLQVVRILLCVDLLFTVPMVLAFGREILERSFFKTSGFRMFSPEFLQKNDTMVRNIIRFILVGIVIGIAAGMNSSSGASNAFENLISLVGGGCGVLLGFVIPPMLYLATLRDSKKLNFNNLSFHLGIIAIGLVLFFSSTYLTINGMIYPDSNTTLTTINTTTTAFTTFTPTTPSTTFINTTSFT